MPFSWGKKRKFNVEEVAGARIDGDAGSRRVLFSSVISIGDMQRLIGELRRSKAALKLHDPLYPSGTDPGAYMDYTQERALPDRWSMTLGNHGWTGGVYQIDDGTVALQVVDLVNRGLLVELPIETGKIFSHYELETNAKNDEMIARLRELHPQEA